MKKSVIKKGRKVIFYIILIMLVVLPNEISRPSTISTNDTISTKKLAESPQNADISGNELYTEQIKFNIGGKHNLIQQAYFTNDTNILAELDLSDPAFNDASFYLSCSNGIIPSINPFPLHESNPNYISLTYTQFHSIIYFEASLPYSQVVAQKDRMLSIFKNLFEIDFIAHETIESPTDGYYYSFFGLTPHWEDYFDITTSNAPKDGYWATFDLSRIASEDYVTSNHLSSSLLYLKRYQLLDDGMNKLGNFKISIPFDLSPLESSNSLFNVALFQQDSENDNSQSNEEDDYSYIKETSNIVCFSIQYEGLDNNIDVNQNDIYQFDMFHALNYLGTKIGISEKCFNSLDGISLSKIDVGLIYGEMVDINPEYFPFDSERVNRISNLLVLVSNDIDFSFLDEYSFKIKWISQDSISMLTTVPVNRKNSSDFINFLELLVDFPSIGSILNDTFDIGGAGLSYGLTGSTIAPITNFTLNYKISEFQPTLNIEKFIQNGNASNIIQDESTPEINVTVSNPNNFAVWGSEVNLTIVGISNDPQKDITLLDLNQNFFELLGFNSDLIENIVETLGYSLDDLFHDENPRFFKLDLNNSGNFDTTYPNLLDLNFNRLFPYSPEFTQLLIDNPAAFGTIANNPQIWNSSASIFNPENWKLDPGEQFSIIVDSGLGEIEDHFSTFRQFNATSIGDFAPILALGSQDPGETIENTFVRNEGLDLTIHSVNYGENNQIQEYLFFNNNSNLIYFENDSINLDAFFIELDSKLTRNDTTIQVEIYDHSFDRENGDGFVTLSNAYNSDNPGIINYTINSIDYNLSNFYDIENDVALTLRITLENSEEFSINIDYIQLSFQDRLNSLIYHNQTNVQYCSLIGHNQYQSASNSLLLGSSDIASLIVHNQVTSINQSTSTYLFNYSIENIGSVEATNISLKISQFGLIPNLSNTSVIMFNNVSKFQSLTGNFSLIDGILYLNLNRLEAGEIIHNLYFISNIPNSIQLPSLNITWINSPQFQESSDQLFTYQSNQYFYSNPDDYASTSTQNRIHNIQIEYELQDDQLAFSVGTQFSVILRIRNINNLAVKGLEIHLLDQIQGLELINQSNTIMIQEISGKNQINFELVYQKVSYCGYFLPMSLNVSCLENSFLQVTLGNHLIIGNFGVNISKQVSSLSGSIRDIIKISITIKNTGTIELENFQVSDAHSYDAKAFLLDEGVTIKDVEILIQNEEITYEYYLKVQNAEGVYTLNPAKIEYYFGIKILTYSLPIQFKVQESYIFLTGRILLPLLLGAVSIIILYKYKTKYSREDFNYQRRERLLFGESLRDSSWHKKNLIEFLSQQELKEEKLE